MLEDQRRLCIFDMDFGACWWLVTFGLLDYMNK